MAHVDVVEKLCSANEDFECIGGKWQRRSNKPRPGHTQGPLGCFQKGTGSGV